jgi:hypothetical protein
MPQSKSNRRHSRKPNFNYTTLKVCGQTVSRQFNLICLLAPHIPHLNHAALAIGEGEIYTIIKTPTQPPLIQLKDGTWHPVEELPNESP